MLLRPPAPEGFGGHLLRASRDREILRSAQREARWRPAGVSIPAHPLDRRTATPAASQAVKFPYVNDYWCALRDSNSDALRQQLLRLRCLPISTKSAWCPPRGIEPGTCCLQGSCSAAELDGQKWTNGRDTERGAAGLFLIVHNVKQRDARAQPHASARIRQTLRSRRGCRTTVQTGAITRAPCCLFVEFRGP